MATKQISQLPSTNISNDTDLFMTRQGAEDKAVSVEKVRNIGTEAGQSLGVGGYGIGGNAIPITDLFASNNADLISRTGHYIINGATNVPVAQGEIEHTQTSATSATQKVIGENEEFYFRKKAAGVWLAWVLTGAEDKAVVRTDLDVYSKAETVTLDNAKLNKTANLSDVSNAATARTNLDALGKTADKASQAEAEAGTIDTKYMTPLQVNQTFEKFLDSLVAGYILDPLIAKYSEESFSLASVGLTGAEGFYVDPTGTRLYAVDKDNDEIVQFSMTKNDITTLAVVNSLDVSATDTVPSAVVFKPDGTIMYFIGDVNDKIFQFGLSTPWDITTATLTSNYNYTVISPAAIDGLNFKSDGTRLYTIDPTNHRVYNFNLSTAWDVTTITNGGYFQLPTASVVYADVFVTPNGKRMFVVDAGIDVVKDYILQTPYDVNSALFVQNFSTNLDGLLNLPQAIQFSATGAYMWVLDVTFARTDTVYKFTTNILKQL